MSVTVPQHIAIIMDGNGRWAQEKNLARTEGHKAGAKAVKKIVTECRRLGVPYLTLYAFSRENWQRPQEEVSLLFSLLLDFLLKEVPTMVRESIRLHILGDVDGLPFAVRKALQHGMERTAPTKEKPTQMQLNLALNYSGRHEIIHAVRQITEDGLTPQEITIEALQERLYTKGQPDPDLLIRTSGEIRLSNYLLFQSAYSELYFCKTYWPDFDTEDLHTALQEYSTRQRRFGKTKEQLA